MPIIDLRFRISSHTATNRGKECKPSLLLTPLDEGDTELTPLEQGEHHLSHSDDSSDPGLEPQEYCQQMVDSMVEENKALLKEQDEIVPKFHKLKEELVMAAKSCNEIQHTHEGIKSQLLKQRECIQVLAALLGINPPTIHPKAGNVPLTAAPAAATVVSAENAQRKGEKPPFLPADCPEISQGHVALKESESSSEKEEQLLPRCAPQVDWGLPSQCPGTSRHMLANSVRVLNPSTQQSSQMPGRLQQSPG